MMRWVTGRQKMALLKKVKGRPVRYTVKLLARMVHSPTSKVLKE